MKFNWGHGIALFYGTFVVVLLSAVFASSRYDHPLVKKNYYDDDINYQTHYNKLQNARHLKKDVMIDYQDVTKSVTLRFPSEVGQPHGKVLLFCPSAGGIDRTFDIETNDSLQMQIPVGDLKKGMWRVKTDWEASSKSYFTEGIVILE